MMLSLDPYAVSPNEMQERISLHAFLDSSGLEESLIEAAAIAQRGMARLDEAETPPIVNNGCLPS